MTEVKLIQKIDSNYGADSKIEINGKQMTIEEYNRPSHFKEVKVKCGKYFSKAPPQIEKVKYYLGSDNDFLNNELKARKLFAEMAGSLMDENGEYPEESIQLQEIRKNEKVNKNLYADINRKKDALNHLYNFNLKNKEVNQEFYNSFTGLNIKHFDNNCKQAKIIVESNNSIWDKIITPWKELVNLELQLKKQKDETGQTPGEEHVPTETPTKDKEKKKENLRKDWKGKIENALKTAKISEEELSDNNWEDLLWHTISIKGINDIGERVLTDIETKRIAKESKVEDKNEWEKETDEAKVKALKEITEALEVAGISKNNLSSDCQNWREQIDQAYTEWNMVGINDIKDKLLADIKNQKEIKVKADQAKKDQDLAKSQKLSNATKEQIDEMEDEKLKESMTLFTRWEGEEGSSNVETTAQIEARLMRDKPELYRETIVGALMERMSDYRISPSQLDEETRKLLRGEITDVNKIKEIKDQAIKEIGTKGAEKKWSSLMSQAKALLDKAKTKIDEHLRKDLKEVQNQLKNFKTGTNSYLTSAYKSNKSEGEKLESQINSFLETNNQEKERIAPWKIAVPICLALVATFAIVVAIKRKKKQQ